MIKIRRLQQLVADMTLEDLDIAFPLLRERERFLRNQVGAQARWQFTIGDTVWFEGRRGILLEGKIEKIGPSKALVTVRKSSLFNEEIGRRWRVPFERLTKGAMPISPI